MWHHSSVGSVIKLSELLRELLPTERPLWFWNLIYSKIMLAKFRNMIKILVKCVIVSCFSPLFFSICFPDVTCYSFISVQVVKNMYFFITDNEEDTLNLALIQYLFDGEEHAVIPRPHAN